ncbi:hypothetical protein [Paraburkholderia bannensis]|uniref:hypothetical protein n=1 Tax=Paraburkholderia bannensis TaxID=765414 RepID=UPI002ABDE8AD|nr:hypothetical protein [Paraburkholderia bannensis]
MSDALSAYFEALERLAKGKCIRVASGTKISNDAVALEAGRSKGSIKKSRAIFADLIVAIRAAAERAAKERNPDKERLQQSKVAAKQLQEQLDAALAREASLVFENYELKKRLVALEGGNVLPLRPRQ